MLLRWLRRSAGDGRGLLEDVGCGQGFGTGLRGGGGRHCEDYMNIGSGERDAGGEGGGKLGIASDVPRWPLSLVCIVFLYYRLTLIHRYML